jgi:hypothetical protein
MNLVGSIIGAAVVFFLVAQFGLRFVYDYRVTGGAVEIVLFRTLPVWRIPFLDIESVRIASWKELNLLGFTTLRLGNRFTSRYVVIKKRGWFRAVAITPADAEKFASQIPVNGPQHAAERRQ